MGHPSDPRRAPASPPPASVDPAPPDPAPADPAPPDPGLPARQRWRLVLARGPDAPPLGGREAIEAWESAVEAAGLPIFRPPGRSRARIAFGAPLPSGAVAEAEFADIVLAEALPVWQVRERLVANLPAGWTLIDLYDVWLGAPALAGQVAAADYRIAVEGAPAAAVEAAARDVMAAEALPRERPKGNSVVQYDLRPLVVGVTVIEAGPPVVIRATTRFDPALGTGRPEEVVAAIAEALGRPLRAESILRERLILSRDSERLAGHQR